MIRKLIALAVVVVVAVAGVTGYVLLSGGLPGGGQSAVSLESVSVVGDSEVRATWRVFNPRDVTVGVWHLAVRVEGSWNIPPLDFDSFPVWTSVLVKIIEFIPCTNIGPGQTVFVDQSYDVFKFMELGNAQRADPYPKVELDAITDWRSAGGLAWFTSGGCGSGQRLCAEVQGSTPKSCLDEPRLVA